MMMIAAESWAEKGGAGDDGWEWRRKLAKEVVVKVRS